MLLKPEFYRRREVLEIAQDLLGMVLLSRVDGKETKGIIVETEAYKAPEDRGSHAFGNLRTKRTEVMFQNGGCAYVYLCYGIHQMFNIVTSIEGEAHAILVRALKPISGERTMIERRAMHQSSFNISNGPGKLTMALGIDRRHNGTNLWDHDSLLTISDEGFRVSRKSIIKGPRVGIAYAKEWAKMPWRFRIRNSSWTSKPDIVDYN